MPELMSQEVRDTVRERLRDLEKPVRLLYFTQTVACGACAQQAALLRELAALSDKLILEEHELVADAVLAKRYGIDKVPATVPLAGEKDFGIRFFGLTGGYEFASLLEAIEMISTGRSGLEPAVEALAKRIRRPTHIEVMVTLTCPYCPSMVQLAHQLAFTNEQVRADMIDAAEYPQLVERYSVQGVPRTVINERPAFEGAMQPAAAVGAILKAVDPEAYADETADAARRQASGERLAHEARAGEPYDVIVVGAGPAGLSAALYAARKNRRVALIGLKLGGQINDTATIENYLGMPQVGGGRDVRRAGLAGRAGDSGSDTDGYSGGTSRMTLYSRSLNSQRPSRLTSTTLGIRTPAAAYSRAARTSLRATFSTVVLPYSYPTSMTQHSQPVHEGERTR